MRRLLLALLALPMLATACEKTKPEPAWRTNDIDRTRLTRLAADPWLKPQQSNPGGTGAGVIPGGNAPLFYRSSTKRWSKDPLSGDAYEALAAEIAAARQAGWFVTGVYCSNSAGRHSDDPALPTGSDDPYLKFSVDRIVVGFAKPARDLDHAAAAYLLEGLRGHYDESSHEYSTQGTILVSGIAPHHADKGWPDYTPVQLADTCIADPHHPRLPAKADATPKANPPPPESSGYGKPLDQDGKPFAAWDDPSRFALSTLKRPGPSVPTGILTR